MEQTDDDILNVTAFSSEHAHELLLEQREIASSYNGTLMNSFAGSVNVNRKFLANKTNNKFYHKRTSKRVEQAKRKARSGFLIIIFFKMYLQNSELQKCGWQSMNYAIYPQINMRPENCLDNIERVDASSMSYEQFVEHYERPGKPVILLGLTNGWKANQRWNLEVFCFF